MNTNRVLTEAAMFGLIVFAGEIADTYASITQDSLCSRFKENVCFTSLPNYDELCADAGSSALVASTFTVLGVALLSFLTSILN